MDDSGLRVESAAINTTGYVVDIHQITAPLDVHGTGDSLQEGQPDFNWSVTSFAGNPAWQSAAAMVCRTYPAYARNDGRSRWVSYEPGLKNSPAGLYTFTTIIDTADFDPSTIHLHIGAAVDDGIPEIRLNGKPTGLKIADTTPFAYMHQFTLDRGFVAGKNRLDVVVKNATVSPMALRIEMSGVGRRLVQDR